MDTETLFDTIAVHCFFACGHVVQRHDPRDAHAAMEAHYETVHAAHVTSLVVSQEVWA